MPKSHISSIVRKHGLKPGDTMRNVHGEEIADSCVIDGYTIIHREDGERGGYRIISENPLLGDETQQFFTADAMAILKAYLP